MSVYSDDAKGKGREERPFSAAIQMNVIYQATPQAILEQLRPRSQIEALPPYSATSISSEPEFSSLWHPENLTASCSYAVYTSTSISLYPSADEAEELRALLWQQSMDQVLAEADIETSDASESHQNQSSKRMPHELTCQAYGDAQWDWERLFGKAKKAKKQERSREEVAVLTEKNDKAAKRRMLMYLSHLGYQAAGQLGTC